MYHLSTPTSIPSRHSTVLAQTKIPSAARWLFAFLLLFAASTKSYAQTSLTIGTGTSSSSYFPIYTCYGYNYSQQTFLASEIVAAGATSGVPGYISSVSFYLNTVLASSFAAKCKDWVVYMGNTSKSTFSSSSDWIGLSSLTKVYDGTVTPSGTGWFKITFPTAFYWDGTSNIVVAIDENTADYYCTASWRGTSRTGTRGLLYYSDATNPNPSSPPTANYSSGLTSNIQVDYTPAVPCSGTTVGGAAVASATSLCPGKTVTLSTTGSTVGTGMTWQWDSASSATGPFYAIPGATSTTYTTTPPSGTTTYYQRKTTCTATGSSDSSTRVAVSVSTSVTVPYSETFESLPVGTNATCAAVTGTWAGAWASYYGYNWTLMGSVTSGYSGSNHTPGGSKYIVAGSYIGTYGGYTAEYWFTPGITLTSGKTYRFSYWYRVGDYMATYYPAGCVFGMYYNTAQTKASGLVAIKPDLAAYASATYAQNTGDFSVPTTGSYYLAVKVDNKGYGYYGGGVIDDIGLIELPACSTATAATFGSGGKVSASPAVICGVPGTTTLSVSSTPPFSGLGFSWEVASGSPTSFDTISGAKTASYAYAIATGGNYYFRCKVTCSATGLSAYSDTILVRTTPITPPYVEDFETGVAGVNMPCASYTYSWSSGSYWYLQAAPYASYAPGITNHTTGGSKYLHAGYALGYGSGADEYWFTPGLALTAAKAYNVSFWFSNSAYDTYYASYGTDLGVRAGTAQSKAAMTIVAGADTTVFINASMTPSYNKLSRSFIASTTGTYYVGIRVKHSYYNYYGMAIDDIGISQLPPCNARPSAGTTIANPSLLCSSTSVSTISLVGTSAASDLTFKWLYSTTGLPGSYDTIPGANLPAYTTTTPAAKMYYRCVVTCPLVSGLNFDTSAPVYLGTTPISLPYTETFESGTSGVNLPCAGYTGTWGSVGTYWNLLDASFSASYPAIANHTPGGRKFLSAGYYLGSYGSGATQYWFTPGLSLFANKAYQVSYWFNGSGYSGGNTLLGVSAGTAQTAAAMTISGDADTTVNTTTYTQLVRKFIAPTTNTYYVGIKVNNLVYSYPGVAIDDIGIIQLPPCNSKPTAGTASATPTLLCTSTSTARLSLVGASYASDLTFQWQYSLTGAAGSWLNAPGASTSPSYTTPTPAAAKYWRCYVACTAISAPNTDTSAPVYVGTTPITPPYTETFESGTIGVNLPCASYTYTWGSAGTYWYLAGSAFGSSYPALINHTLGGSKYLHAGYYIGSYGSGAAQYWFSPAIALTAGKTYEGSYWYNGSGYAGGATTLGLYYGTAQTAAAMTTALLADKVGENTTIYKQLTGRFIAPTTGTYYLGVKVNSTVYSYPGVAIDDIGLIQLPPCSGIPTAGAISSAPTMLCSPGTVALTMDLSGVSKVAGLSYRWYDSSATSGTWLPRSGVLTAPSFTTPTVSVTTWYRCVVKCIATGDSVVSMTLQINVGAIIPPYIETFESASPGVNVPCASYSYSFGTYYYWNTMNAPLSYGPTPLDNHTVGGSKYLIAGYYIGYPAYSGFTEDFWLSPAITLTAGKRYQINYWYQTDGYSGANYKCAVYMGTTQSKAGMTTLLGTILNPTNTAYNEYKYQFIASASGNFYFGLMKGAAGYGYGIAFDDIGVREVPPCSAPVVAGSIFADPLRVCAVGGTTNLDVMGGTLATGLNYRWLSATSAAGPYTATTGITLPYTTDPLVVNTWFKLVVTCAATGATDTSAAYKVNVGGQDLPYIEDFETTSPGQKPLCSDATAWGMYYYDGWNVYLGTYTGSYGNHTPGGNKHLIAGYYLGYSTYTPTYTTLTDNNYWFTPGLNMRGGYKYKLNFWYIGAAPGYVTNRMGVFYGKAQTPSAMTRTIAPFVSRSNTVYVNLDTTFIIPSTGVYYVGFKKSNGTVLGSSSGLGAYGVAFDDINLNYAPCDGMPNAGNILSSSPSGTAKCKNTMITLTDTGATIALVPGIKFQWQRNLISFPPTTAWSNVVGATDTVLTSDSLVGYEYRLAVTCNNTGDVAYSPSFQIPALTPHPAVTINPSITPINYCLGDSVKFTATSFSGATYDWMLDSAVVFGWKFNDLGATNPGVYMVKVTSPLSLCPTWSNKVTLVANDPGYKVTIATPTDSIICTGSSMLLTATASKSGVSYQWRKNNIMIPGATTASYNVTSGGAYSVTAFDGISTCAAISRSINITVQPNPPAVITVPGGTTTACENEGVLLNANTGGYSYQWERGGSTIVGWTDSSILVKTSGVYTVKVRSKYGCVSVSAAKTVNILPAPTPTITRSGSGYSIILSTTTFASYQWSRNGVDISGATGSSYGPLTKEGIYRVRVTNANDCIGETMIEIMDEDGVLAIGSVATLSDNIKIYPNPTLSKVFIQSPVSVLVKVTDLAGKVVIEPQETKEVDLSKYADGVYLFMISDKDGNELIKQQRVTKTSNK
ncbi:MAG: T9SS type A sorting domain-containing protein [Phycisphaerales bacterium]|nr:T9SS type A sorting domain-containing protein [Phycisphaerales bacterium]